MGAFSSDASERFEDLRGIRLGMEVARGPTIPNGRDASQFTRWPCQSRSLPDAKNRSLLWSPLGGAVLAAGAFPFRGSPSGSDS